MLKNFPTICLGVCYVENPAVHVDPRKLSYVKFDFLLLATIAASLQMFYALQEKLQRCYTRQGLVQLVWQRRNKIAREVPSIKLILTPSIKLNGT